jgi:hypothetical protein
MTAHIIKRASELSPENSIYNLTGFSGTAYANATTDVDFKMAGERWLVGGTLLVGGGNWGDTATIQIVDKDNILGYGANVVLNQFVTNLQIRNDVTLQEKLEVSYVSLVPKDIYIRIKYTNTSGNPVGVACNLFLHKPKDATS